MNFIKLNDTCPTCGCKVIHKKEECEFDRIHDGLFCENCQEWVMVTSYSKLSMDKTRYKLTFSLSDANERARKEILSMCPGENVRQGQLAEKNISIINNAETLYGIIQRLKGFDIVYEVKPPYPYEVKGWDGYMDKDFLQELAKLNPGLDIEGVLKLQQEE